MKNTNVIYVKTYDGRDLEHFPVNEKEIWRYSGYMGLTEAIDEELRKLLMRLCEEVQSELQFKVCYRRMELKWKDGMPMLPFVCHSKNLAQCLSGCDEVVFFAATIGLGIDRKITRYEKVSPVKALLLHAYGAERIESLCDGFCRELELEAAKQNRYCSNRFSPGYGDLPLETQVDFFKLMDCNRKIGISLNDSLLMTPSKSVTAIFGLGNCEPVRLNNSCRNCLKSNCEYRKRNEE